MLRLLIVLFKLTKVVAEQRLRTKYVVLRSHPLVALDKDLGIEKILRGAVLHVKEL